MSGPLGSQQWMYASGGFYDHTIDNSLRFNDNDSAYLNRTFSAGNRKTWTWSGWVKRSNLSSVQRLFYEGNGSSSETNIYFTNDRIQFEYYVAPTNYYIRTEQYFRDTSSWYHLVVVLDTTNANSADRMRFYLNGSRITNLNAQVQPPINQDMTINSATAHYIGVRTTTGTGYFDGYMADVNFIDGQALDATSFGEFKSGIWIPKDTSGLTFGTNGFRLAYADSAAIGDDTSGNTNDWTANNLAASDVVLDSPTNNFGVMSSIDKGDGTATYSEGNLKVSVGDNEEAFGSFGMSSGKWYWEIRYISTASGNNKIGLGIADTAAPNNNEVTNNGHQGTTYAPNDILAVAVDVDNELFSFYKNGTIIETDTDWSAKGWTSIKPIVTSSNSAGEEVCVLNFGQDDTFAGAISATGNTDENGQGVFKYTPPSGFLALCSANLPSGAIDTLADETPEDYFNTVLWTGNGTSQSITGVGFQSDLVWTKKRSSTSAHYLVDAVRGSDKVLFGNLTDAEVTTSNVISSLDSDGFSIGADGGINASGQTYVGWNWKANAAGVANTDGSITSTVSVGATSQQNWFSIVDFTGAGSAGTVGHGLGVVPSFIVYKRRNASGDSWIVYHDGISNSENGGIYLNLTNVWNSDGSLWNNTAPTSSVFSVGTYGGASGENRIAYCFANAEGLCRAGKYTGNGSTDGTFVYTGFRPSFLLVKNTSIINQIWLLLDSKRGSENVISETLEANNSNAESNNDRVDFVSNGFKWRNNYQNQNNSGNNFIYLAIAEQPFKYANAR